VIVKRTELAHVATLFLEVCEREHKLLVVHRVCGVCTSLAGEWGVLFGELFEEV